MVAAGVPKLENRPDCIHFGAAGHVLGTRHTLRDDFTAYVPSRPHLEWQIRRRVDAIPVNVATGAAAMPRFVPDRQERVTGVLRRRPTTSQAPSPPTWWSTPPAAAPAFRSGWSSGVSTARPRTTSTSASATPRQQVRIPDGRSRRRWSSSRARRAEHPVGLGMLLYEDGTLDRHDVRDRQS